MVTTAVPVTAYKNYVGGEWIDAESGKTFEVVNPATLSRSQRCRMPAALRCSGRLRPQSWRSPSGRSGPRAIATGS